MGGATARDGGAVGGAGEGVGVFNGGIGSVPPPQERVIFFFWGGGDTFKDVSARWLIIFSVGIGEF